MGNFKIFFLGIASAYAIYFITKKRDDGASLLDDLMDNPSAFMDNAKEYALDQAARFVNKKIL